MKKSILFVWIVACLCIFNIFINFSQDLKKNITKSFHLTYISPLDNDLKQNFIKLCNHDLNKVDKFLNDSISITKFINCNTFCKKFMLRDITFEEYLKAHVFINNNNFSMSEFSIALFIIWDTFFIQRFQREMTVKEYKQLLIFKSEIFEYDDFCNFINSNNFYKLKFFRSINLKEYKSLKSFYTFCKEKRLNLNQEELNCMLIVYFNLGFDGIKIIYDCFNNNIFFKNAIFIIYSWIENGNIVEKNLLIQDYLTPLLKVNKIHNFFYKQDISYSEFKNLCLKSKVCQIFDLPSLMLITNRKISNLKSENNKNYPYIKNQKIIQSNFLIEAKNFNILKKQLSFKEDLSDHCLKNTKDDKSSIDQYNVEQNLIFKSNKFGSTQMMNDQFIVNFLNLLSFVVFILI